MTIYAGEPPVPVAMRLTQSGCRHGVLNRWYERAVGSISDLCKMGHLFIMVSPSYQLCLIQSVMFITELSN